MNRAQASQLLPPFRNQVDIVAGLGIGTNGKLMQEILSSYPKAVAQTAALAPRFKRATDLETKKAIWDFLRNEIQYREDSGFLQRVKLPNALVATGFGDCKSYTLFAAGILANLGYPVTIRFAGYNGATQPGHVYALSGSTIIDGVFPKFNAEKLPMSYKKDYNMQIERISGIGCANCGPGCDCAIGKIELAKSVRAAGKAVKTVKAKAVEAVKKAAPVVVQKTAQVVKKAAGLAPRTAFLQLVKLNVHSFANRLDRNRQKALDLWRKIGGDPGELNASINAGKQRKAILGLDETNGIGEAVAVSVATVLATAAPVIALMATVLGNKEAQPQATNTGTNTANQDAASIIDNARTIIEKFKPKETATEPSPAPGGATFTSGGERTQTESQAAAAEVNTAQSTGGGNKWLLPAAAVLALLLLTK